MRPPFAMLAPCGLVLVLLALAPRVSAQGARPEDVQSAAAAFGEGQRAQLAGDYAQAADLFELADRTAPSSAALRSAIRNHRAAGHASRAATLSLSALARYPDEAETAALARETLDALAPSLGRVLIRCSSPCSVAIDGRVLSRGPVESLEAFVDPGARQVVASWPEREPVAQTVDAVAGATAELVLEMPPEIEVVDAGPDYSGEPTLEQLASRVPIDAPPPRSSGGVTPIVFAVGAGLTAVALGIGIGLGVDTLAARDAYVLDPTEARYRDGTAREWATTGTFIAAGVLGLSTLVVAIFTDWDGDASADRGAVRVRPLASLGPEGGAAGLVLSW